MDRRFAVFFGVVDVRYLEWEVWASESPQYNGHSQAGAELRARPQLRSWVRSTGKVRREGKCIGNTPGGPVGASSRQERPRPPRREQITADANEQTRLTADR